MPFLKPSSRTLAILASAIVLSLSAGYIALAWTEPVGTMPVTVAAPLNTGTTAQTKAGALAITGNLTASILYDADNTAYYVNPAGQTVLAGSIGIGTANPTDLLSLSPNGGGINIRQGAYAYLGTDYSAWTTVLGQNVRARRGTNVGMELGSSYLGSGASAIRMNWNNIEFHAASATDIASLSEGSVFNFPKMTIQSDGKVIINNGGQFCIGTACVASSTWATIVNNAGSGGGSGSIFYGATDTGSVNAFAISVSPAPSAYIDGQIFEFTPANANTGASTLNVNSLGPVPIYKKGGTTGLVSGDIAKNGKLIVAASVIGGGTVKDSYPESNYNTDQQLYIYNNGGPRGQGQSFTISNFSKLTSASFYMKKTGSPTGTLQAHIYSHSGVYGSSSVAGSLLANSNVINASSLSGSMQMITFDFSGSDQIYMQPGNYVVTVEIAGGYISYVDYVSVGRDSSPSAGGNVSTLYGGQPWFPESGYDSIFYINGTATATKFDMLSQVNVPVSSASCYSASGGSYVGSGNITYGTWNCNAGYYVAGLEQIINSGYPITKITCCPLY